MNSRRVLFAMAVACMTAVGVALAGQHGFDMQPCPWCILQRMIFVAIAVVALAGSIATSPLARAFTATLAILLALAGGAAAAWQHVAAARSTSCQLTLADRIISATRLDRLLPDAFEPRASCADAAVDLLGVPFEYWSLALFVLLVAAATLSMRPPRASR
jgi:disulfide bond formation protein DsbB